MDVVLGRLDAPLFDPLANNCPVCVCVSVRGRAHVCVCVCVVCFIYLLVERERERERESKLVRMCQSLYVCVTVTVRLPVTATKIQSWANTNTLDSAGYKHTFIGTQTLPTYCTAITTTSVKIHTLKIPTLKGLPFNTWQALDRAGQWQSTDSDGQM